jgi:tetratricopeptide (TPR) repeat protein
LLLVIIGGGVSFNGQSLDETARYFELVSSIAPSYENYYRAGVYALINGELNKSRQYLEAVSKRPGAIFTLGVVYYQLGLYDLSAEHFERLLKKRSDIWQAYYYLGLIKLRQNEVTAATQYFEEIPDSIDIVLLIDYIADYNELVSARQKFERALFQDAIKQYQNVSSFFGYREIGLALAFSKIEEYETSLLLFDSVICYSDNETVRQRATYESARIYYFLRDDVKARKYLRQYLTFQTNYQAQFLLGMTFSNESRYDSAVHYFEALPDSVDQYLFHRGRAVYFLGLWGKAEELASINFKRKEYDQAIDFYSELVRIYPKSLYAAVAQKNLGDSYFHLKEYKQALKSYNLVKDFNPSQNIAAQIVLRTYETLYYLKKYPSLIDALQRFIEDNPGSSLVSSTQLRIAKILYKKQEYYRSLSALNSYAADELGMIYFEESKYDSVLYYYNLLLENEKYREKAIFEIAKTYDILGQSKEAETMTDKLITEFPLSVFLFDAYILKSKIYRRAGYYDKAVEILEDLIRKAGERPEVYVEIGNLYIEIEDYLSAREYYLLACEFFKQKRDDAARTLLFAGDASIGLGEKEVARQYYLQANSIALSLSLKNQATARISAIDEE